MSGVAQGILLAALALLCGLARAQQAATTTQAQRLDLAEHAIGLQFAFYEAQRAGVKPNDSAALFPNIWEWKNPGYTNICSDFLKTVPAADRAKADFATKAGYFEAGNAVLVTGPTAFTATQQAIGALQFMPLLADMKPGDAFGDPAGCLNGGFSAVSLKELLLRQIRYLAATLSNSMVVTRADNSDFVMLIGVADSSTYGAEAYTSWNAPPAYSQKCYIADMDNPAAEIAAQAAAGLAMTAKVLATHGTAADKKLAEQYGVEAARAYEYAKMMLLKHDRDAICFRSSALTNCVGTGCTKVDEEGEAVLSPCLLYLNKKFAPEYIFVGAAALYALTGQPFYRADADALWPSSENSVEQQTFLYNWNNILTQGIIILSMQPDVPGAVRSRDFYRRFLRTSVSLWSQCSNEGEAIINYYKFCERTPDGSAYPLDFPWGNLGTAMNGMCAAGMYQALAYDSVDSEARKDAACFMQRQLGYTFNHKCATDGYSCNTNGPDGFSYMVGIGRYFPTKVHSRDAAYPYFYNDREENTGMLCGGLVSGPYARNSPTDGPVRQGTDMYENDRERWQASEAAIDYTSSLVCTLMAYATMPDSLFEDCPARSPFTGRGI
eukprot:jgi/Ulvmu1/10064/UM006_0011.1